MKTLLINLYAGPGAGKSTLAAQLFSKLKMETTVPVELVQEVAKEYAWQKSPVPQVDCFWEQVKRIDRLLGNAKIVICDSPLLLQSVYGGERYKDLAQVIQDQWNSEDIDTCNYMIKRTKQYQKEGRYETEEQAKELDEKIKKTLLTNYIIFSEGPTDQLLNLIMDDIRRHFK